MAKRCALFPAEIAAWTPPEELTVAEWADKYRVLDPITSAEPGPWRTDRTPYLRGIFDAFLDPRYEQITIMASTQVAKTETMLNLLGYLIDQDPGPALFVMPREADAKKMAHRRFRPMLESSPRLARYISEAKSDRKTIEYRLGQSLVSFAWANSPAALASTPARYLFLDEVDKYPAFSGKEADPISLAEERQRTFWNRKRVLASTPTTADGYISRAWETSTQALYYLPCAKCDGFQTMKFPSIRWPEDVRDPNTIRSDQLCVYVCEHCERELNEDDRRRMLGRGVWCPDGCRIDESGDVLGSPRDVNNAGFHLSALLSPWLTMSEIAAKFLEAKDDTPRLLNFVNSWLGEKWEERGETLSPAHVAARACHHHRGTVPEEAVVLTGGVDVQQNHIYYTIRAWGPGETSWLVEADRVESWEQLLAILTRSAFPVVGSSDTSLRVRLTCIDSGHRTDEVYGVCRRFPDLLRPIKGQQKIAGGVPIRMTRVERNYQGQTARTGVKLWHLDTSHFKDKLVRLMRTPLEESGAWQLHADPAEEYLREVTSEHKVVRIDRKTGRTHSAWTVRPGHGANHWLDCEVYALAAADMLGVHLYGAIEDEVTEPAPSPTPNTARINTELARDRSFDSKQSKRKSTHGGSWVNKAPNRRGPSGWVK